MPSRLIGHSLKARIFDNRIELLLAGQHIETLPRGRAPKGGRGARTHVINYCHIIHSLCQKPGALEAYRVPVRDDDGDDAPELAPTQDQATWWSEGARFPP